MSVAGRNSPATAGLLAAAALLSLAALLAFVNRHGSGPHLTAHHSLPWSGLLSAAAGQQLQQQDSRLEVLHGCTNFACLRAANALPPSPGERFNFPHMFILGFQKCATTSLAAYLTAHPQAAGSTPKEPWFFTRNGNCSHPNSSAAWGCNQQAQQRYLLQSLHRDAVLDSGLTQAAFEASPDYISASYAEVAAIRRELPWLKLVVSMREPISQKMSSIVHWGEFMSITPRPDWLQKKEIDRKAVPRRDCSERLFKNETSMYDCLLVAFQEHPEVAGEYHVNLQTWLSVYPLERFHMVQYENLTTNPAAVLADLQRFVGLDPTLAPQQLPGENIRKVTYHSNGWPMKRREYEHILSIARPRAQQTAAVLEQHGFAVAKEWLAPWEAAWQRNLASCTPNGDCLIKVT